MNRINIDELLEILPKLIRENDTVKGAIISALSGVVATHEDVVELTRAMDKRFEAMQKSMDERFEAMDKRFEAMQKSMDERFEAIDKRFERVDRRFDHLEFQNKEMKSILENIQQSLERPFEQFGRNVIIKLLKSEGYEKISLEPQKLKDPEFFVSDNTTEVEIDGLSLDPPIIVEITSILRTKNKIDIFLRKKKFLEKSYEIEFRGFFLAASSEFSSEEMADIAVKLRENNCELINL
ncbi:MAG: hypothetical protein GF317_10355 [Candidatus Lokiarchaeota archaeon]|nr:hypothetical protein [Candidatus Lokiarchaeota archaeon]MBD3200055.1 hypothetical protein [Candidatus Lokiarchaeota archaeon]